MKKFVSILLKYHYILIYIIIYALILLPLIHGVGLYWDWTFPLYKSDIHNYFNFSDSSWVQKNNGTPLSYSSDYFFRLFISLFSAVKPEYLIYSILIVIFAFTSSIVHSYSLYKGFNKYSSYIFGLLAIINSAIFYKFNAGHLNYFFSYALFTLMLVNILKNGLITIKQYTIIALLLGAMLVQIQFSLIGTLFVLIYMIFNLKYIKLKYVLLFSIIPIAMNVFWLTNFISGANDITVIREQARSVSVVSSKSLEFVDIFTGKFAGSTQITKYFQYYQLAIISLVLTIVIFLFAFAPKTIHEIKKLKRNEIVLLIYLVITIFLATGFIFKNNNIIGNTIGPMFREVGHFAPIIYLISSIIIIEKMQLIKKYLRVIIYFTLSLIIIISASSFINNSQSLNYNSLRNQFISFKPYLDNSKSYRVLSYPFFDQYSYSGKLPAIKDGFPISNTGHDSFLKFSGSDYINNAIPPNEFTSSVQYKFLKSYNVNLLKKYNIKYILNFSHIYESNYNNYVPSSIYQNDINLIKNDKDFFKKILEVNGDKVKLINNDVIEIIDTDSRVQAFDNIQTIDKNQNIDALTDYSSSIGNTNSYFTRTQNDGNLMNVFNNIDVNNYIPGTSNVISNTGQTDINGYESYQKKYTKETYFKYTDNSFMLYQQYFNLENNKSGIKGSNIFRSNLVNGEVEISYNGNSNYIKPGQSGSIGVIPTGSQVSIKTLDGSLKQSLILKNDEEYIKSSDNLPRTSVAYLGNDLNNFNKDEIYKKAKLKIVNDCNKYDQNSDIYSGLDPNNNIVLGARRHTACLNIDSNNLLSGKKYILSFKSMVSKGNNYGYFIDYGQDTEKSNYISKKIRVNDKTWQNNQIIVTMPSYAKMLRLYIYAFEPTEENSGNEVKYNDFSLKEATDLEGMIIYKKTVNDTALLKTSYNRVSNTNFKGKIKNARGTIYVKFAENANNGWILKSGNSVIHKKIIIDDYANGWVINTDELCKSQTSLCQKNNNGTYDISYSGTFTSQKWFVIGLIISIVVPSSAIIYVIFANRKRKIA